MATHISDEELTAYLDGQADLDLSQRIERALIGDAEFANRLDRLRFDVGTLKIEADNILDKAPSFATPPLATSRSFGVTGAAMAACLALGIGLGFVASYQPAEQQGWMHYVAAYQALYVKDTLAGADGAGANIEELSDVLGHDLSPITQSSELQFKRAQQLGFNGKPLIQIAYLSDGGAPLALCIIAKTGDPAPVTQTVLEGMQAASWSDGTFAYLLIGGKDAELVRRSAAQFEAQL